MAMRDDPKQVLPCAIWQSHSPQACMSYVIHGQLREGVRGWPHPPPKRLLRCWGDPRQRSVPPAGLGQAIRRAPVGLPSWAGAYTLTHTLAAHLPRQRAARHTIHRIIHFVIHKSRRHSTALDTTRQCQTSLQPFLPLMALTRHDGHPPAQRCHLFHAVARQQHRAACTHTHTDCNKHTGTFMASRG
jgi:hypothetical protein